MEKGWVFQEETTLSGNSCYEKEKDRPYSFVAQSVHKFLDSIQVYNFSIAFTGSNTKEIGNLNSDFEKADSPPPPTCPEKGVDSQKVSVSAPKILQNCVYEYC
jgi:hypothetical protein